MGGLFHSNQNGFDSCIWWQKEVLAETSSFESKCSMGRRIHRVRVVSILETDILNRDAASAKVLSEGGVSLRQYIPPPVRRPAWGVEGLMAEVSNTRAAVHRGDQRCMEVGKLAQT